MIKRTAPFKTLFLKNESIRGNPMTIAIAFAKTDTAVKGYKERSCPDKNPKGFLRGIEIGPDNISKA